MAIFDRVTRLFRSDPDAAVGDDGESHDDALQEAKAAHRAAVDRAADAREDHARLLDSEPADGASEEEIARWHKAVEDAEAALRDAVEDVERCAEKLSDAVEAAEGEPAAEGTEEGGSTEVEPEPDEGRLRRSEVMEEPAAIEAEVEPTVDDDGTPAVREPSAMTDVLRSTNALQEEIYGTVVGGAEAMEPVDVGPGIDASELRPPDVDVEPPPEGTVGGGGSEPAAPGPEGLGLLGTEVVDLTADSATGETSRTEGVVEAGAGAPSRDEGVGEPADEGGLVAATDVESVGLVDDIGMEDVPPIDLAEPWEGPDGAGDLDEPGDLDDAGDEIVVDEDDDLGGEP